MANRLNRKMGRLALFEEEEEEGGDVRLGESEKNSLNVGAYFRTHGQS